MKKIQIILVGCGNLGQILLRAWSGQSWFGNTWVVQPSKRADWKQLVPAPEELPGDFEPDVVVFANKPQQAFQIVPLYQKYSKAIFVSVMSGVSLERLTSWLNSEAPVVRMMPSLAASVCESLTLMMSNRQLSDEQVVQVTSMAESIGKVLWLEQEALFEAATPICGSGPAYFFWLTECLMQTAMGQGFSAEVAALLAEQTLIGSGALVREMGDPKRLRESVSSPGGITLAALKILEIWPQQIDQAVQAAIKRSKELNQ